MPAAEQVRVKLPGTAWEGAGTTRSEAIEDLARELTEVVAEWDADGDIYRAVGHELLNRWTEPEVVRWARARLLAGDLEDALRERATLAEPDSAQG